MPRGGRRPGAGRKTNAQIQNVRTILTDTMTDAQWKALFRRLHELALDGNMRAASLLLNYRFGDPHAEPDPDGPPIRIRTIEAHLSERSMSAQRPRRTPARRMPAPTTPADYSDDHAAPESSIPAPHSMPAQPKSNEWAELDAYYNTDKW